MSQVQQFLTAVAAAVAAGVILVLLTRGKRFYDWWYSENHPDRAPKFAFASFYETAEQKRERKCREEARAAAYKMKVRNYRITKLLEALFALACLGFAIFLLWAYWPNNSN